MSLKGKNHRNRCQFLVLLLTLLFTAMTDAKEPRPLPDYSARLLGSDQKVTFAGLQGQVILINTWATWCPPCRTEMPDFETIHQRYKDQGLAVVGVNIDEGQADESVASYVKGMGISFAIWRDPHNRFSKRFRSLGVVPETYLVDRKGMIIKHWQGPVDPNASDNLTLIQAALGGTADSEAGVHAPSSDATARRGKRLAEQRGCLNCHSIDGSPGAGPTWLGLAGTDVKLADGRIIARDRAYLRRAIDNPDSDIVAGYTAGVMTGAMPGKRLRPEQIETLILYLESLTK